MEEKRNGSIYILCFRPDTQRFLEKLKRQQEAKLNQQEADNRPFILKYVSRSLSFDKLNITQLHIGRDSCLTPMHYSKIISTRSRIDLNSENRFSQTSTKSSL